MRNCISCTVLTRTDETQLHFSAVDFNWNTLVTGHKNLNHPTSPMKPLPTSATHLSKLHRIRFSQSAKRRDVACTLRTVRGWKIL